VVKVVPKRTIDKCLHQREFFMETSGDYCIGLDSNCDIKSVRWREFVFNTSAASSVIVIARIEDFKNRYEEGSRIKEYKFRSNTKNKLAVQLRNNDFNDQDIERLGRSIFSFLKSIKSNVTQMYKTVTRYIEAVV